MTNIPLQYNKNNPFLASLKDKRRLSKIGSQKNTHHLVIDFSNSGIEYHVGDSVAIFPQHDPELVQLTLDYLQATGKELVHDKHAANPLPLQVVLTSKANITEVTRKLLMEIEKKQSDLEKKAHIQSLLLPEHKKEFKEYTEVREVWDVLKENSEVSLSPQELCDCLMPLLPRFYSIASSHLLYPNEVHLTVAPLEYEANHHKRRGVCTHFLCSLAMLNEPMIPLYIQPSHGFQPPEDSSKSMIMVGPGTGVAPFRAFMQERMAINATGGHWLFFGDRNREYDFFYEDYWLELVAQGKLKLDVAFSRDQDHKIYVQNRMWEHRDELFTWLENGAYLYVCGDAHHMAKDVEATLLQIIQHSGKVNEENAKAYLKKLRTEKRYLRDVY